MNSKGFNRAIMVCLWIVLAFMYLPIIAIIGMSPYVFTFDWYTTLFTTSNLLPACWFSLKFAFAVTLAAVVIGTMTSYGLQSYKPALADKLNSLIVCNQYIDLKRYVYSFRSKNCLDAFANHITDGKTLKGEILKC